jgi:hypothetical protein
MRFDARNCWGEPLWGAETAITDGIDSIQLPAIGGPDVDCFQVQTWWMLRAATYA